VQTEMAPPAYRWQERNLIIAIIARAVIDYLLPHLCSHPSDMQSAITFVEGKGIDRLCSIVEIEPRKKELISMRHKSFEERKRYLHDIRLSIRKYNERRIY